MAVITYSPDQLVITVGGFQLSGFAENTFINISRESDAMVKYVGADGTVSRAQQLNRSGEITFTLAQTSVSNTVLTNFAIQDENSQDGVFPVLIKDSLNGDEFFAANAWVRKMPDSEYSNEISTREWILDCDKLEMKLGNGGQE